MPGGERQAARAALQRGQALLERAPGRVVGARVLVALDPARRVAEFLAAQPADAVLLVGRDLVDRRHHRAGYRVRLLASVDRECLEPVLCISAPLRVASLRRQLSAGLAPGRPLSAFWLGQERQHVLAGDHPGRLAVDQHDCRAGAAAARCAAALTGSPEPTDGSGGDISAATWSSGAALPGDQRLEQVMLDDRADHLGRHHRRLGAQHRQLRDVELAQAGITVRTVSVGCACTNCGSAEPPCAPARRRPAARPSPRSGSRSRPSSRR